MKQKVILVLILIFIVAAGYFFVSRMSGQASPPQNNPSNPASDSSSAQIVSTNPDPLNEAIIPTNQILEITFNKPLQNIGEFKVRIEPKIEYKIELSGDRKTGKVIPAQPFELGASYALYIGPDTKFDGVGAWGQDKTFHFRTIRYRGI